LSEGERCWRFDVEVPKHLRRYIVNQGSITINGVSLTVGEIEDESSVVTLWLIPETIARTNLGSLREGEPVNVEVDILAKYVERIVKFGEMK
jgi:riboflavin synthase